MLSEEAEELLELSEMEQATDSKAAVNSANDKRNLIMSGVSTMMGLFDKVKG